MVHENEKNSPVSPTRLRHQEQRLTRGVDDAEAKKANCLSINYYPLKYCKFWNYIIITDVRMCPPLPMKVSISCYDSYNTKQRHPFQWYRAQIVNGKTEKRSSELLYRNEKT